MNDQQNIPLLPAKFDAMGDAAMASFQTVSAAYANWFKSANRLQAEALRFVTDRLNKDRDLLARFAACKKPEDVVNLQSEAATELVNDYLEEGARWFALLGNTNRTADGATKS